MPAEVPPKQIVCGVTQANGSGITVTTTLLLFLLQPFELTSKIVYVVVVVGHTCKVARDELNPTGLLDHEY